MLTNHYQIISLLLVYLTHPEPNTITLTLIYVLDHAKYNGVQRFTGAPCIWDIDLWKIGNFNLLTQIKHVWLKIRHLTYFQVGPLWTIILLYKRAINPPPMRWRYVYLSVCGLFGSEIHEYDDDYFPRTERGASGEGAGIFFSIPQGMAHHSPPLRPWQRGVTTTRNSTQYSTKSVVKCCGNCPTDIQ